MDCIRDSFQLLLYEITLKPSDLQQPQSRRSVEGGSALDSERIFPEEPQLLQDKALPSHSGVFIYGVPDSLSSLPEVCLFGVSFSLPPSRLDVCISDSLPSRSVVCIYRVPDSLRKLYRKAFVPQLVSLGPYHRNLKPLLEMDRHKWRALYHILQRTKHDLQDYIDAVEELEPRARACYEGTISLNPEEFVLMMLLDGCFVIELLRGAKEGFEQLGYSSNDPIFAARGSIFSIQRDMIKLENQLPLFVLDRLLRLQLDNPDQKGRLTELISYFFDALMPTDEPSAKSLVQGSNLEDTPTNDDCFHCLDTFRESLLRINSERPRGLLRISSETDFNFPESVQPRKQVIRSAIALLSKHGINFRKRKTDRFWDIKFENGTLHIPRFLISDRTKELLLNLIAFEQCNPERRNTFTSYVVFMGDLIKSQEDVSYLRQCGIIDHWFDSDSEVVYLFNCICKAVDFDCRTCHLYSLKEDINRYYRTLHWHAWCPIVVKMYPISNSSGFGIWISIYACVLILKYFCGMKATIFPPLESVLLFLLTTLTTLLTT
ncbi:hypothetical protein CJ030_MR5G009724 [Morella rubra]|uniref:Uncharacterized protein n=1 Tax=Morella rubra TaxID=262757 RepID=A0A6A1V177_9ROSI|nr:hypothetical protein CJ030_MR7G027603 [Morella rubra]KAB1212682.1 hypothetical protein CJ030_MR5G009724 [Morella rubra]